MTASQRTPLTWFRNVATEMLVVVVSILLAFQVDEWREVSARNETLDLIGERIRGDLQSDAESLRNTLGAVERAEASIREAITLVQSGPPFSDADAEVSHSAFRADFLFPADYTPTGHELLVSEGLMTRLSSLELQSALIERATLGERLDDRRVELEENFWTREAALHLAVGVREVGGIARLRTLYDLDAIRAGDPRLQAALADAAGTQAFWAVTLRGQLRNTLQADSLLATSR